MAYKLSQQFGDFIVRRRDNIFAYQLAAVVDDHKQQVNEVFRGNDLLDSTAMQIYIQQALQLPKPKYSHVPVLLNQAGSKLSKQTGAPPVGDSNREETLFMLLTLLNQNPPSDIRTARTEDIIDWAIKHWDISKLYGQKQIALPLPANK